MRMLASEQARKVEAMKIMDAGELGANIDEVLREVERGEIVDVMRAGQVVARIAPPPAQEKPIDRDANGAWTELLRLRDEISADWPEGISAQDAINDVRRDL